MSNNLNVVLSLDLEGRRRFVEPSNARNQLGSIEELSSRIGNKPVYILTGYGSASHFRDISQLERVVREIISIMQNDSVLLYFGDPVNDSKPDIGYAIYLVQKYANDFRKTVNICMIQIRSAQSWGVSDKLKISDILWHNYQEGVSWKDDGKEYCKWGGIDRREGREEPCSNTKVWVELVKSGMNIRSVFILGGGPITMEDLRLFIALQVPVCFYALRRKYAGDGKTLVESLDDPTKQQVYGDLHEFVFKGINNKYE